jgi:hypothetical protein
VNIFTYIQYRYIGAESEQEEELSGVSTSAADRSVKEQSALFCSLKEQIVTVSASDAYLQLLQMLHFPNKQAFSSFGRALERWKAGAPTVAEMGVRARCDVRSNSDPPSSVLRLQLASTS